VINNLFFILLQLKLEKCFLLGLLLTSCIAEVPE